ncbi:MULTISPECIES: hypothetical protein [Bacillus]|uniref:hypothetical protein n=1 Tax=Bacillus TaxID=1386 RepID=UPI00119FB19B|nr:hypothetical protein [Bacillus pumilus]
MDNYILNMQVKEFKLKLFMSDGQVFEDLFCELMSTVNPDFRKVRAFGRQGDEKNDGFVPSKGEYFQCYGPEDISKETTEKYAKKKLKEDFKKLLDKWNGRWKLNRFSYVINDKYKGTPVSVLKELTMLKNEYSEISFDILDSQGLENLFISKLNKMQRGQIVGINPAEVILEMNKYIINQPINDLDMLGWFKVINNNIQEKIIKLTKLRVENWYNFEQNYIVRDGYIGDLINFMSKQEEMKNEFLEFLKGKYTSLFYVWSKYFNNEKEIVIRLINKMQLDEFVIFKVTGFDYQSFVDESITGIVRMFNEIVKINNSTFGLDSLNVIQQSFDKVNQVIFYNKNQKNHKINEIMRSILESQNYNSVTVFQNSKKGFELDLDIKKFFESYPGNILNGDMLVGDKIVKILISRYESITEDAKVQFSPHVRTNHIIFLEEFLNNNDKLEIKKLQKRSNIAIYYFEEYNN